MCLNTSIHATTNLANNAYGLIPCFADWALAELAVPVPSNFAIKSLVQKMSNFHTPAPHPHRALRYRFADWAPAELARENTPDSFPSKPPAKMLC